MLRALIFDFDGLIVDTESPVFECVGRAFAEHGAELTLDVWTKIIGGNAEGFEIYGHLERLIGRPVDRDAIRERVRAEANEMVAKLPTRDGVEDYLHAAQERGLLLGVASSSSRASVEPRLERVGLLAYFDTVKTRDDVVAMKPAPELYLAVLDELGVAARDAIALEDSPNGVTAAKAAGLFCVAVPNDVTRAMPLDHADLVVGSLAELPLAELVAVFGG